MRVFRTKYWVLIFWVACLGCSRKVNKFPNRAFHSTTTKYNVLFNGQQSLDEAIFKLHDGYVEDYDKILPVYVFPDEETAKTLLPELNRAIEKASKAIQRHSMYIKKKERNAYIDDAYFLLGEASLYKHDFTKALEVFNYMTIAYKREEYGHRAEVAMAKTNLEMGQKEEAFTILQKLEANKNMSSIALQEYHSTYAEYYIREKNHSLAITELKLAIENTKRKKTKARYAFIIGQLYEAMDNKSLASKAFDDVLTYKPPFELAFQAKTKKALASEAHKSIQEAEVELKKLLRKSPEGSSKSLIYIALSELSLKKGNQTQALEYLAQASKHTSDDKTKKKVYLKFATLYFNNKDYMNAQLYYDSALTVTQKKDEQYEQIYSLRNNLTRLSNNVKIIQYEDSLQALAMLDEDTRKKKVEKLIEDAKKNPTTSQAPATNTNNTNTNASWYFSNETTRNFGYKEFKKLWGNRILEDDWRRKVKSIANINPDNMIESFNPEQAESDSANLERYLNNIPTTPEKLQASHNKKIEAYYDLGIVYMEQLKEPELAIENFKVIIEHYDTSKYVVSSAYFIYALSQQINDQNTASTYKNLILSKFPDSEYAQVVKNPNYFIEKKKSAEKILPIYADAYALFKKEDYIACLDRINIVESDYPDNMVTSKFALLKAFCEGKLHGQEYFIQSLTSVEKTFKNTDEAKEASRLLTLLKNTKKDQETSFSSPEGYKYDPYAEHQFVAVVSMASHADLSPIKSEISDFNAKYFEGKLFQISDLLLSSDYQLIIVKSQKNLKEGLDYFEIFKQEGNSIIDTYQLQIFSISSPNLSILYKNKDLTAYMAFFNANYLAD